MRKEHMRVWENARMNEILRAQCVYENIKLFIEREKHSSKISNNNNNNNKRLFNRIKDTSNNDSLDWDKDIPAKKNE